MTLTDLHLIRNFLTKVVVRGPEEDQLISLVARIDSVLEKHQDTRAA